jgi:hypothetical protein
MCTFKKNKMSILHHYATFDIEEATSNKDPILMMQHDKTMQSK